MKSFYYPASLIPGVCLILSQFVFNAPGADGAVPMISFLLYDGTLGLSILLTLIGLLLISDSISFQESPLKPSLATVLSALPGILAFLLAPASN